MANNLKTYSFMTVITLISSLLLSYSYSALKVLTDEKESVDDKDAEKEIAQEEDIATAEELVSDDESKLDTVSNEEAK